jgi:tetratricopeptide (TPR) repeat protein
MASPRFILALLFVIALSLGSILERWFGNEAGNQKQSANVMNMLVGESRMMFANYFFAKADAYFHKGYYPSIFDTPKKEAESHMTGHEEHEGTNHVDEAEKEDEGYLGPPKDWIDKFGRNFFSSHHSHASGGNAREILPWLRLSADLDPGHAETYVIGSYWLRSKLGKVDEAEQFLREGLRANPDSCEIYYELGRIYDENRHEAVLARNLWEIALKKWIAQEEKAETENKPELKPDKLLYEELTGHLARLEENQGNYAQALRYLELLKKVSPVPDEIQKQIDELRAKSSARK